MFSSLHTVTCILLSGMLILGCGKKDADTASIDSTGATDTASMGQSDSDSAESATRAAAPSADASSRPLTVQDIALWEKGMAGELRAVQEAGTKLKGARTQEDTLTAMMAPQETETAAAGARAAGLDEERYKFVRSQFSEVLKYLAPLELGIDTTKLPQAQRDELRAARETQLQQMAGVMPSDVIEALKPRASELRKKDLELTFARLKAAGMTPTS